MAGLIYDQHDGEAVPLGTFADDKLEAGDSQHLVQDARCRLQVRPLYPADRAGGDDSNATALLVLRRPDGGLTYISVRLPPKRISNTRAGVTAAIDRLVKKMPVLGIEFRRIARTSLCADELGSTAAAEAVAPKVKPRRPWRGMRPRPETRKGGS